MIDFHGLSELFFGKMLSPASTCVICAKHPFVVSVFGTFCGFLSYLLFNNFKALMGTRNGFKTIISSLELAESSLKIKSSGFLLQSRLCSREPERFIMDLV